MRIITTSVHGPADYAIGLLLLVSPWVFGFAGVPLAKWLVIILGAGVLLISLLTNYEAGAIKAIPMPVHLALDGLVGVLLIIAPLVLGFSAAVWIPFVVLGAIEVAAALTTETTVTADQLR